MMASMSALTAFPKIVIMSMGNPEKKKIEAKTMGGSEDVIVARATKKHPPRQRKDPKREKIFSIF